MRTSSSQFDLMVTFMEQHGDLSKPSFDSRGRITAIKNWEELIELLNSDGGGNTNTFDKWKKVWSDLKNNTKKKAARLHREASSTGGGPAIYAKLTDLERRVLNLVGVQVATGLDVAEAGLPQSIHAEANSSPPFTLAKEEVQGSQPWTVPESSTQYIAPVLLPPQTRPTTAPIRLFVEVQEEDTGMQSPSMPSSQVHVVRHPELVLPGQTTPHRARPRRRSRGSPRRRATPAHTEQAAQQFLEAEESWRNFKMEQHRDYMDMRRERNRIREMEVQTQREWQALGSRALDLLEKLANNYLL